MVEHTTAPLLPTCNSTPSIVLWVFTWHLNLAPAWEALEIIFWQFWLYLERSIIAAGERTEEMGFPTNALQRAVLSGRVSNATCEEV